MYRSEISERIGTMLKRANVSPIARASITKAILGEFKDILNEQIDAVIECCLLVLCEHYGFGKKRCNEFMTHINERVDSAYDDYGLDTLIKFQMELKKHGIDYKTILDVKKEEKEKNGKQ